MVHAVAPIQHSLVIDENGPGELRVGNIGSSGRGALKRHDSDPDSQILKCLFPLLQLQQMPAAGKSTEMAVKHQQEPQSLKVAEPVSASVNIRQLERNSTLSRPGSPVFNHAVFPFLSTGGRGSEERAG